MRVSRLPGMREFFQENEMQQASGVAPSVPWYLYGEEKYKLFHNLSHYPENYGPHGPDNWIAEALSKDNKPDAGKLRQIQDKLRALQLKGNFHAQVAPEHEGEGYVRVLEDEDAVEEYQPSPMYQPPVTPAYPGTPVYQPSPEYQEYQPSPGPYEEPL